MLIIETLISTYWNFRYDWHREVSDLLRAVQQRLSELRTPNQASKGSK